jgi:hypothetical protein
MAVFLDASASGDFACGTTAIDWMGAVRKASDETGFLLYHYSCLV